MNDILPPLEPTRNSSKPDHNKDFSRLEREVAKHMFRSDLPRRFFIFEGIDGSGKTGLIKFLRHKLSALTKRRVEIIRQPGYTEVGEKVRDIIKHSQGLDWVTEILLLEDTRIEMAKKINQILKEDPETIFLLDRHADSTWVHQVRDTAAGDFYTDLLSNLASQEVSFVQGFTANAGPENESETITFFLDVSPEESLKRCQFRVLENGEPRDRFDLAPVELRRTWRQKYVGQILNRPFDYIVVNADRPAKIIGEEVLAACLVLLKLDGLSNPLASKLPPSDLS